MRRGPPPIGPSAEGQGAILLSVTIREGWLKSIKAREARFIRLGVPGDVDQAEIASNFNSRGYLYLLDVPPGRYAPTSAYYLERGRKVEVRFDESVSKSAALTVGKDEIAFAGDFEFSAGHAGWSKVFSLKKHERGKEAELDALESARKDLGATLWGQALERRSAALGTSLAPVQDAKEKVLYRKEEVLHRQHVGSFSYVDVLDWGEPRKIVGGFEWRDLKDSARVAATYLTPGQKGYKTKDEYLLHLRSVGSTEDSHHISEVPISGRTGHRARYTTYYYPEGTLVGSDVKVYVTEVLLVPDKVGIYLFIYRAEKRSFPKHLSRFRKFCEHISLGPPSLSP